MSSGHTGACAAPHHARSQTICLGAVVRCGPEPMPLSPVPVGVTLIGDKVFADDQVGMRSPGWALNHYDHVLTEFKLPELGRQCEHSKDITAHQGDTVAAGWDAGSRFSLEAPGTSGPAHTLILDCSHQPPLFKLLSMWCLVMATESTQTQGDESTQQCQAGGCEASRGRSCGPRCARCCPVPHPKDQGGSWDATWPRGFQDVLWPRVSTAFEKAHSRIC